MAYYTTYNGYFNQMQYYYPYASAAHSYSSYPMMNDGSFQNHYYAVDSKNRQNRQNRQYRQSPQSSQSSNGAANLVKSLFKAIVGIFSDDEDDGPNTSFNTMPTMNMLTTM